jgi:hypothetical protein
LPLGGVISGANLVRYAIPSASRKLNDIIFTDVFTDVKVELDSGVMTNLCQKSRQPEG